MPTKVKKAKPAADNYETTVEGCGDYYIIEVRARTEFKWFKLHEVGDPGHILRLEGLRDNGTKDDQSWLVSKQDAHVEKRFLIADTKQAKQVLDICGPTIQVEGDLFIRELRKEAR
jgi:hypothetical protein